MLSPQGLCALSLLGHTLGSAGDSWGVLLPLRHTLTRLDLGFCGLGSLPPELASLTVLQVGRTLQGGLSAGAQLSATSQLARCSSCPRGCALGAGHYWAWWGLLTGLGSLKACLLHAVQDLDLQNNGGLSEAHPMFLHALRALPPTRLSLRNCFLNPLSLLPLASLKVVPARKAGVGKCGRCAAITWAVHAHGSAAPQIYSHIICRHECKSTSVCDE